jgi:hypothetical protein
MTTVIESNGFKITTNNSNTFFVIDCNNDCYFATSSFLKAKNRLKSILKGYGKTL